MQKAARRQRYERRQPETPRKAHRRQVQAAVKLMKARLYAPKLKQTSRGRRSSRQPALHALKSVLLPATTVTARLRPEPRHHPP